MIVFDIETEANLEALGFLPSPTAPANYKDPEKIATYIAEKRQSQIADAALDADFGMITAAAVKIDNYRTVGWLANDRRSERDLIRTLWYCLGTFQDLIVGYNIIGFDFPYLLRRSFALGIRPPFIPRLSRYQTEPICDLMFILANWDNTKIKGLKFIAQRYEIPNPLPEVDGSVYASLDDETKLAYVKNDVIMTFILFDRMRFIYM